MFTSLLVKTLLTALVVVAVSELARRSSLWAALLASLPLTSVLAFCWLYHDTRDPGQVAALSRDILWLVPPSLVLFAALPRLLEAGLGFGWALAVSAALTAAAYAALLWVRAAFGGGA